MIFKTILKAPSESHKDKVTRRAHANMADSVTSCSPDPESIESMSLVIEDNDHYVLIGTSTDF